MTKKSHSSLFFLTLVTAIGLIVGGFFVPPTGGIIEVVASIRYR